MERLKCVLAFGPFLGVVVFANWVSGEEKNFGRTRASHRERIADVCLILEGSYPFVVGGVSSWTDALIRKLPELSFSILAIQPRHAVPQVSYPRPENVVTAQLIEIPGDGSFMSRDQGSDGGHLADVLERLVINADVDALRQLMRFSLEASDDRQDKDAVWKLVREAYERLAPGTSFSQFFWIWHTLFGSLLQTLQCKIPRARIYHTISTGYAGILASRAKLQTGAPMLLTEHGIYAHERFVDLTSNDQLHDSFSLDPLHMSDRHEGRDVWLLAFESFARICYHWSDTVVTLSENGRAAQLELGAPSERSMVIPNGIDVDLFSKTTLRRKAPDPRIGFIGRVVAIKDVETFIRSVRILKDEFPGVEAWIVGPTEEEPEYYARCQSLVEEMDLGDQVTFKGLQNVSDVLGEIDLMVLTSISEAQPLTLLEAGAAGVPCIASDVGSCRDIIMGAPSEKPRLGIGGVITDLISPEDSAGAIASLLRDRNRLRARGRALKKRVLTHYRQEQMIDAYRNLYQSLMSRVDGQEMQMKVEV